MAKTQAQRCLDKAWSDVKDDLKAHLEEFIAYATPLLKNLNAIFDDPIEFRDRDHRSLFQGWRVIVRYGRWEIAQIEAFVDIERPDKLASLGVMMMAVTRKEPWILSHSARRECFTWPMFKGMFLEQAVFDYADTVDLLKETIERIEKGPKEWAP